MDYESMSARQLQEECRRRGLPTARAKADMVQRLTEADAAQPYDDGGVLPPGVVTVVNETGAPEPVIPAPDPEPPALAPPTTVRCTFPAGPEGPGEEEHLTYRQTTIQTAIEQGLTPRGDAYRTGTVDGYEVYEVRVRQVT